MTEENIWMLLRLMPYICGTLMLLFMLVISIPGRKRILLTACVEFGGLIRDKSKNSRWYRRKEEWLIRNGADYHYGKWVQPTAFLALKIVLSLAGMVVVSVWSVLAGLAAGIVLFILPDILLLYMNSQDNLKLLPEIKLVYHALEIQIRAGVYVTDALSECYGSVREPRLKQALLDLAGDIVMKADIYDALERLQSRFDNRYVDSLCITILQALESGMAVELLGDISEQIKDMENAVLERQKASLDRSITFYQLGVLVAVMGVVLYACVTNMYSVAIHF